MTFFVGQCPKEQLLYPAIHIFTDKLNRVDVHLIHFYITVSSPVG